MPSSPSELIDLGFRGITGAVGVYLLETDAGPALYDCGPTSTLPNLRSALASRGLALRDVGHLLLSHVHLDHAGAAGTIVREHPSLRVWVSGIGAPHLVEPARLEDSARRVFGRERFDEVFGELAPVPAANIELAEGDVLGWEAFPTPGHARHHVAYFRDGTLLAGDACGVRRVPKPEVLPFSPPPDIDVEVWHETIDEIERRRPERLALSHFGFADDPAEHLALLRDELDRWTALVASGIELERFVQLTQPDSDRDAAMYAEVAPFEHSWHGLRRYLDKRSQAA